eukprot:CAMPEP_0114348402 /NCGR_PEP_ID=MMETSP0101-20121206/14667_1 /TAXON_ID=38822 ORGANISM="Pteridomonas danica, Strain PT" /NCGR_SAMPLE_ID=MMETSP0101 /ASSEMBLY_ACC=CAM_ASM_000211 /LENGTH=175 /DNA_ID=CAMNT_0001486281 /DNA_START=232 /DNA_END=759 /DNA_ORIENTATION=+
MSNEKTNKKKKNKNSNKGKGGEEDDESGVIFIANKDASEFVSDLVQHDIIPNHVIMNLPDSAVSFLPCLNEWRQKITLSSATASPVPLICVHCYCFSNAIDPLGDAVKQVEDSLNFQLKPKDLTDKDGGDSTSPPPPTSFIKHVELVRSVSANKHMVCVSFYLPPMKKTQSPPTF